MTYFNLRVVTTAEVLSAVAENRESALSQFGALLGKKLTFTESDGAPEYLLGETEQSLHWVRTDIPVFGS